MCIHLPHCFDWSSIYLRSRLEIHDYPSPSSAITHQAAVSSDENYLLRSTKMPTYGYPSNLVPALHHHVPILLYSTLPIARDMGVGENQCFQGVYRLHNLWIVASRSHISQDLRLRDQSFRWRRCFEKCILTFTSSCL